MSINRLIFDIEVSPNLALIWKSGYKVSVNYDSIVKERAIICIGHKWHGEKKRHILTWDKNQDDRQMLVDFIKVVDEADEIVAYFGDSFDIPWIKTRCLFHGLIFPNTKTVDPLQWARRKFYFNSCKLDYVSKFIGMQGKTDTRYQLWKDIMLRNCQKSLQAMSRYCANDLILLEGVYDRLSEQVGSKTHVGVLMGGEKWQCPHEGSENVVKSKTRVTSAGTKQHQMKCSDCGRYFQINEKSFRDYIEAKREKE